MVGNSKAFAIQHRRTRRLIGDFVERRNTSAIDLLQYLGARCATQPDELLRQHPQIWSRYPLNGPFSLLPRQP